MFLRWFRGGLGWFWVGFGVFWGWFWGGFRIFWGFPMVLAPKPFLPSSPLPIWVPLYPPQGQFLGGPTWGRGDADHQSLGHGAEGAPVITQHLGQVRRGHTWGGSAPLWGHPKTSWGAPNLQVVGSQLRIQGTAVKEAGLGWAPLDEAEPPRQVRVVPKVGAESHRGCGDMAKGWGHHSAPRETGMVPGGAGDPKTHPL